MLFTNLSSKGVYAYGSKEKIEQLPIPKTSETDQQPFIDLANKILIAKKTNQDSSDLETQIDKLVYQLYDLTATEIKIIEQNN